jgi:hypothetical protein
MPEWSTVPNTLVITKHGPQADRILDAFADRTGLPSRDGEGARIFSLEGAGHAVDVLAELQAIDPAWADHVELATQV